MSFFSWRFEKGRFFDSCSFFYRRGSRCEEICNSSQSGEKAEEQGRGRRRRRKRKKKEEEEEEEEEKKEEEKKKRRTRRNKKEPRRRRERKKKKTEKQKKKTHISMSPRTLKLWAAYAAMKMLRHIIAAAMSLTAMAWCS